MKSEVIWGTYKPQYIIFINDVEIYINGQKEYLSKLKDWYKVYNILKQHIVDPSKDFNTKEEVEQIINNWKGNQLSTISETNGKFRLYAQNPVSIGIEKAIKKVESFLKLNIPLGFEWAAGKNWYECH